MASMKRDVLSVALASAILAMASAAHAQDPEQEKEQAEETEASAEKQAAPKTLDAVQVTGIRSAIESAIELKQDATGIVDAISAEDLGKLPDISIADSLSRLPGLAAQRVAGRSSTISIRGLAGDYGTTLLNGREQVSVGDNRTVEFDQFPSELIHGAVVYKTPDASLVGQGLSGTIDLRTVRPLTYGERTVSLNARLERNSLGELNADSDDTGSRISAFYVNQFANDTVGVALGYARLDAPGQANRWEAWGYPTLGDGSALLGGSKSLASSTDNVRQGLMGVFEYKPGEHYETTVDLYYSKFEKAETTRFLEVGLGWSGATLSNPVVEDGVVVSGTFTGVRPVLRNDLNEGDDKLFAIGWNNVFRPNDAWSIEADLSYSSADREESILETYSGTRAGVTDTVDFVLDPNGRPTLSFGLDYTDPNAIVLTDPGGWGQDGYIKKPEIDDTLSSLRLSAERSFEQGWLSSVEFGVNYADREKQRQVPEAFLDLIADETVLPGDLILPPVDLGFTGIPGSFAYEINEVLARYYTLRDNINADILNKQWTVNEKLTTGYVQFNVDAQWGSVPVRGNFGVQVVRADQDSDGFSLVQGNAADAVPFSGGTTYTDVLPSLNLSFNFEHDQILRFGLARQMARPRVDQMRASNNSNIEFSGPNAGEWSRSGGNPELEPWIADAADLSYEKYFASRGYFSFAYFIKDLRSYIYDQVTEFDFTGFEPPAGYTGPTPSPIGSYSRPANGSGGEIKGFEVALSVPFDLIHPALEGFGLVANYSNTDSKIKRLGPDGPDEPIAGLSKEVTNITFYYENAGFSARVSQRSRSDFLGEIQGFGADRALVNIDGETVYDFQAGYAFGAGKLDGLSILLQVNNLTDEPYRQYFVGGLSQRYEEYGRQYLLGVNYKF